MHKGPESRRSLYDHSQEIMALIDDLYVFGQIGTDVANLFDVFDNKTNAGVISVAYKLEIFNRIHRYVDEIYTLQIRQSIPPKTAENAEQMQLLVDQLYSEITSFEIYTKDAQIILRINMAKVTLDAITRENRAVISASKNTEKDADKPVIRRITRRAIIIDSKKSSN